MVISLKHIIFVAIGLLSLTPIISAPYALLAGILLALLGWVPTHINLQLLVKCLLAIAIVGLGFGVNAQQALSVNVTNLPALLVFIVATMLLGLLLMKVFRMHSETGVLIAAGTAICGGSAIAATAPAIRASQERVGIALACVFILNAVALWLFPWIGHYVGLSQQQFGIWTAFAIHDTASVVAAAQHYGDEALVIATSLKLARALAIVPLVIAIAYLWARFGALRDDKVKQKWPVVPLFILFYVVAMLIATFLPQGESTYQLLSELAKALMVGCIFLIGASLNLKQLQSIGLAPLLYAVSLWLLVAIASLFWVIAAR